MISPSREGNEARGRVIPEGDSLSWKVRRRPPPPILTDFTETVTIQTPPPETEDKITQVQRNRQAAAACGTNPGQRTYPKGRSSGGPCPPAFLCRCLPGRSMPSGRADRRIPDRRAKGVSDLAQVLLNVSFV